MLGRDLRSNLNQFFTDHQVNPDTIDLLVDTGYCSNPLALRLLNQWLTSTYPTLKLQSSNESIQWVERKLRPWVNYLNSHPHIDQARIKEKLTAYCQRYPQYDHRTKSTRPRDAALIAKLVSGYCVAFSVLVGHAFILEATPRRMLNGEVIPRDDWTWLKGVFQLLSTWDPENSARTFTSTETADIERLLSLLEGIQNKETYLPSHNSSSWERFFDTIHGRKLESVFSIGGTFKQHEIHSQLSETLCRKTEHKEEKEKKTSSVKAEGAAVELAPIGSDLHMTVFIKINNHLRYYDSNNLTGPIIVLNAEQAARLIMAAHAFFPNYHSPFGMTILSEQKLSFPAVETLIEKTENAKQPDNKNASYCNGITPLIHAVRTGSIPSTQAWLKLGANIEEADTNGDRALHVAAVFNQPELASLLLAKNAETESKNLCEYTPLTMASIKNATDVMKVLLNSNAHIETRDNLQNTPLINAVYADSFAAITTLLEHKADVDAKNSVGKSALHIAAEKNSVNSILLLQRYQAKADITDPVGQTPLDYAARANAASALRALLEYKRHHINWQNSFLGETALIAASKSKAADAAAVLLAHGADMEIKDHKDMTALIHAIYHNDIPVIETLLKAGANTETRGMQRTPLHYAVAVSSSIPAMQLLLNKGAQLYARTPSGGTAFHLAAEQKDLACMEYLLAHEMRSQATLIGLNLRDRNGYTPLHLAAKKGSKEMVKLLLQAGADPLALSYHGIAPFALSPHQETAQILVDAMIARLASLRVVSNTGLSHASCRFFVSSSGNSPTSAANTAAYTPALTA